MGFGRWYVTIVWFKLQLNPPMSESNISNCTTIVPIGFWDDHGRIDSQASEITNVMAHLCGLTVTPTETYIERKGCVAERTMMDISWVEKRAEAHKIQAVYRHRNRLARE